MELREGLNEAFWEKTLPRSEAAEAMPREIIGEELSSLSEAGHHPRRPARCVAEEEAMDEERRGSLSLRDPVEACPRKLGEAQDRPFNPLRDVGL